MHKGKDMNLSMEDRELILGQWLRTEDGKTLIISEELRCNLLQMINCAYKAGRGDAYDKWKSSCAMNGNCINNR